MGCSVEFSTVELSIIEVLITSWDVLLLDVELSFKVLITSWDVLLLDVEFSTVELSFKVLITRSWGLKF